MNSIIIKLKTTDKGKVKPGTKGASKGAAGGSKGKATKGKTLKSKTKKGAKKLAVATETNKEDNLVPSMTQSQELCKSFNLVSQVKVSQPPSDSDICLGCEKVSDIPHQAD